MAPPHRTSVKYVYVPADVSEPLQQWTASFDGEQAELECVLDAVKVRAWRRAGTAGGGWRGDGGAAPCCPPHWARVWALPPAGRTQSHLHPPNIHRQAHFKKTKPTKSAAQRAAQQAAFLARLPEDQRSAVPAGMLDTVSDLGALENVALLSNAPEHGFVGVNLYADDEGQALGLPRNLRACEIAACAGKPLDVCGDAFLARVMDSEAEFARLDLTLDEVSSSAPWVKAAADQNRRKAASESAEARLARARAKAGPAPARPASAAAPPCPHREAGNAAFGAGKWGDAVAHYTEAVDAAAAGSPSALAALNNRAAARLKAGDADGAECDATAVLAARPGDVKALLRRGAAREARCDRAGAAADFRAAAAVEPGNKQAADGVARCG